MTESTKLITWEHLISYYTISELQLASFNLDYQQLAHWKATDTTHELRHRVTIVDHHNQSLSNLSDIISEPNPNFSMSSSIVASSPVANKSHLLTYPPVASSPRAVADHMSSPREIIIPSGDDFVADL